jgi:hypothetical protein
VNGASERTLASTFLASDQQGRVARSRDAGLGYRPTDLRVGAFHLTLGVFGSHGALEVSDLIAWPAVADQTLDDGRHLIGSDSPGRITERPTPEHADRRHDVWLRGHGGPCESRLGLSQCLEQIERRLVTET